MKKQKILVIMGGKSTEREISLRSGAVVASALREAGFSVEELDLSKESLSRIAEISPDAAFIALHGKGGEDGAVQGLLEWMEIPYTGPGIAASAICLDKILTKKILSLSGVPTPEFVEIGQQEKENIPDVCEKAVRKLGLPLVLKACRQGSSIGTVIVKTKEEVAPALRELFSYGDSILAETFLSGMELSVPVMGNDKIEVLPIIQITSEGEFYDFESKYTPGKSTHIIPAPLTKKQEKAVSDVARRAYLATGCRGFSRVDVMLDETGEPQVIEINTVPGMTAASLFPDAARHAGIELPQLVERLILLALGEE